MAHKELPMIYLARHGETAWSLTGQHTGLTDLPLTPMGESNAGKLRDALKSVRFTRVFSSPLRRAWRTCELAGFRSTVEMNHDLIEWELAGQQTYPITVRISALDRPGLLNEITNVVAEYKVNIVAASVATHPDGTAVITATFKVESLQQLARVLAKIERLRDITSVTREAR